MILREMSGSDTGMVAQWERHPDNARYVIPWEESRHAAALEDPDLRYFIVSGDGDEALGFVLLAGLANEHDAVEFRRIVVAEKGRGHGRAAVEAVKRYCFEELGAHRLWLDVLEENARARALYESVGFRVEGVLRECLKREDRFHSLVVMSMLSSEYADQGTR